ncbi:hypothetical protein [Streptomyces sp. TP-A0356]|uniref:hypothetical protein n=1 Tax=Streptomyces sp. TP-A0356 TaxID=1359208 RepID=UPI000A9A163C|nr:hypothetical protein [Streptomyces sp. TP-A0356]
MRQSVKLGVATAIAVVSLFGGASTASAYSGSETSRDVPSACDDGVTEATCQIGEDNENVTINGTVNITVAGDFGELTFGPDLT